MKQLCCGVIALAMALFLGGCGQEKPGESSDGLRVGYHPNFGGASAVSIGIEKGYFADEGLDVELVRFTSGPPSIAALAAGDIDVSFLGHGAYTLVLEGQADVIAVDCLSNAEEILARADSGILTVADLEGKRLAAPFGTSGENFLDAALDFYTLPRSAIQVVNMDVTGAVSALVQGKVDAVSIWAPYTNEIREQLGEENVVTVADCMDFRDVMALPMCWVATDAYIEKHGDVLLRFVRALYRCLDYRAENLDETATLVAKRLDMSDEELLPDTRTAEWFTSESARQYLWDGSIEKWYRDQQDFFLKKGAISEPVRLDSYMHLEFMREVLPRR